MTPLYGLLLAGGKSTRMGFDKGAIDYHGKSQVDHGRELLAKVCETVYVSGLDLPDEEENAGPIAGLRAANRRHPEAAWLVLACDLPGADETAIRYLISRRGKEATAFGTPDSPEPLFAIYESGLMARAGKFQSPRALLASADCIWVSPSADWVTNVNTPLELASWMASRNAASDFRR